MKTQLSNLPGISPVKRTIMILFFILFVSHLNAQNPCSSIWSIAGLGASYQQTFDISGTGVWDFNLCGYNPMGTGIEKVYSFTAPYSATYKIHVVGDGDFSYTNVIYAWKTGTCDTSDWYCIGNISNQYYGGIYGSMYWNTGVYYILLKYESTLNSPNHTFYIIAEPNAPVLTTTAISSNQVVLSWNDVDGETGYKIYRAASPGGTYTLVGQVATNVTSYSDVDVLLAPNNDYCYKVKAYNNDAESIYSNESCATTLPFPPSSPTNLTTTAISNSEINVSWSDVNDETGYKIYRALSPCGTYTLIDSTSADVTFIYDIGLSAQTQYCYKVKAYNLGGFSYYSNEDCAFTLPVPPSTPTNLTALASSNSQIHLSWDDVVDESGYRIYRAPSIMGSYSLIDSTLAEVTSYENNGLVAATQYCYKVKAYNFVGGSYFSNVDCAMTLSTGVNTIELEGDICVKPNPTEGRFLVTNKSIINKIEVLNLVGKKVLETVCNNTSCEVDLSRFDSGVYLLRVQSLEQTEQIKIIKY